MLRFSVSLINSLAFTKVGMQRLPTRAHQYRRSKINPETEEKERDNSKVDNTLNFYYIFFHLLSVLVM